MKSDNLIWGALLILVGALILLRDLGYIFFSWGDFLAYWPVLIILWGISILPVKHYVRTVFMLAVIVGSLVLMADKGQLRSDGYFPERGERGAEILHQPFDSAYTVAGFHFKAGAGQFTLFPSSENLFLVEAEGRELNLGASRNGTQEYSNFIVNLETPRRQRRRDMSRAEIFLNEFPAWHLKFEFGAAEVELDLRNFDVRTFEMNAGAASIDVTFPAPLTDETHVDISAGASSVTLNLPTGIAIEIISSSALSSRRFPGFTESGRNTWRTENYDEGERRIQIWLKTGVSNLDVNWY